jgi:hypothetical protein
VAVAGTEPDVRQQPDAASRRPQRRPERELSARDFGTAVDVTVAELRLEAFLPADEGTASILAERGGAVADERYASAALVCASATRAIRAAAPSRAPAESSAEVAFATRRPVMPPPRRIDTDAISSAPDSSFDSS